MRKVTEGQWQRERWIEWYLHAGRGLEQDWAGSRWLDRGKRIYTHTLITALYCETITRVHTYALHHMKNEQKKKNQKQPTFFTSLFTNKNKTHTFEWRTSLAILKRLSEKTKVNKATVHLSTFWLPSLVCCTLLQGPAGACSSHKMSQKDFISFLKRHRDFLYTAGHWSF